MNGNTDNTTGERNPQRKTSKLEIILSLCLISSLIYLMFCKFSVQKEIVQEFDCPNPDCYESVNEIYKYIDPTIDPCENFHQFVCGNYFEIMCLERSVSPILQEQEKLNNELDAMILEPISSKDSNGVKIQKRFYQACLDVDGDDINLNKKVLNLIERIGGWPLLEGAKWNEENFDWVKAMVLCKRIGLPFQWFFEYDLHVEDGINYLKIAYPNIETSNSKSFMENILSNFLERRVSIKEVFDFEQRLKKITDSQKNQIVLETVQELQEIHPQLKWQQILNMITEDGFELDEETLVASNVESYIVDLYQLLKGTSKRIQANYIVWKIIEYFAPYMSHNIRQYVGIQMQNASRSKICKQLTESNFPYFSEIEYNKRYFSKDTIITVKDLINSIRNEFLKRIEDSSWWNTTAGQIYLTTFNNTEIDISFNHNENEMVNDEFLDANYLHIQKFNSSENMDVIELITEKRKYYYESLFSNINKTGIHPKEKELVEKIRHAAVFYDKDLNKMLIPPAMLHGFLYGDKRPQYLNFASLGSVIAKEFILSLQDITKNEENITNVAFEASNKCLEIDYSNLEENAKVNFDGSKLIEEIIPDILARDIAYVAYQNWVSTNEDETELPLLSYTTNQLFWIKSSLINCYKKFGDTEDDLELTKSEFTNILSLRHSRYFASDFECPKESSMNPSKKC